MSPETQSESHLSFEAVGVTIEAYQEKSLEYSGALLVNRVHDEEGFATISGEELEEWKKKFPRIEDEQVAHLRREEEEATEQLVDKLNLDSADVISPLLEVYSTEKSRRILEDELGQDEREPFRTGITLDSLHIEPYEMINAVIALSKITGEPYITHTGIKRGGSYLYAYVTVEPASEVDEIVAEYNRRGLLLPAPEAA